VARLNAILDAEGIPSAVARVDFDSATVGGEKAIRLTGRWERYDSPVVDEKKLRDLLPTLREAAEKIRIADATEAAKEAAEKAGKAAGYPATGIVVVESTEDGSEEETRWHDWAKRAIARIVAGETADAVCAEEIAAGRQHDAVLTDIRYTIDAAISRGVLELNRWSFDGRWALALPAKRGGNRLVAWHDRDAKTPLHDQGEPDPRAQRWDVPPAVVAAWPAIRAAIGPRLTPAYLARQSVARAVRPLLSRSPWLPNRRELERVLKEISTEFPGVIDPAYVTAVWERAARLNHCRLARRWAAEDAGRPAPSIGLARLHPDARALFARLWKPPAAAKSVAPEVTPEVAPEVTPEVAPEVTPEVTPAPTTSHVGPTLADVFARVGL
jgi:hypothetical protein